jgi:hypothetical protein
MFAHSLELKPRKIMEIIKMGKLPTQSGPQKTLINSKQGVSSADKIETIGKDQNQYQERLIFVSPSEEQKLEDASNEGCNI